MTKLLKTPSLCTISLEISHWNVHWFTPVFNRNVLMYFQSLPHSPDEHYLHGGCTDRWGWQRDHSYYPAIIWSLGPSNWFAPQQYCCYNICHKICTQLVMLCFVVIMSPAPSDWWDQFTHILQGCFIRCACAAISWLSLCQSCNSGDK